MWVSRTSEEGERGEGEEQGVAARPSTPSPACPWSRQSNKQLRAPQLPPSSLEGKGVSRQDPESLDSLDGLGREKVKNQEPEEETQVSGNLPEGSLSFLAAPSRTAVKQGHPVQFESQIDNEYIFSVTMFQILMGVL